MLQITPNEVPGRIEGLLERVTALEKELGSVRARHQSDVAAELAEQAESVSSSALVVADAGNLDGNELRQVALGVRDRLGGSGLVVLGSSAGGKGALIAVATKDLVEKGVSAGELLAPAAREVGGGGSRDPELAQAGGPDGDRLKAALDIARADAEKALSAT